MLSVVSCLTMSYPICSPYLGYHIYLFSILGNVISYMLRGNRHVALQKLLNMGINHLSLHSFARVHILYIFWFFSWHCGFSCCVYSLYTCINFIVKDSSLIFMANAPP